MKMKFSTLKKLGLLGLVTLFGANASAQHNNEFYNDGALVTIQAGAEVYVMGDVHNYRASGTLDNNGLLEVQGHMLSDALFQQRGTGTTRMINNDVNIGTTQYISGSYAVRGGQAQIGVNDGSFFNLELANDQGYIWLNGAGNIADVRGTVDFNGPGAPTINRIITHNPLALPANGSGYSAVFGVMNPAAGLASMADNTVNLNGNMSTQDYGYVQGKLRRAIAPGGGVYGYVLGLEPAGAGAQRGMQYIHLNFTGANNYDVIEGHFQSGSPNNVGAPLECSGWVMDYYGGADHGEWQFTDFSGTGSGPYEVQVWPQDDNFPPKSIWAISKDDALVGTANQCGPSPVALARGGFSGFSDFGVVAADVFLGTKLIDLRATPIENRYIQVDWATAEEHDVRHFEVERSTDNMSFQYLTTHNAVGNSQVRSDYSIDDNAVLPNQDYYYRVKTVYNDNTSEYTHAVVARITRETNGEGVVVFPNPVSNGSAIVEVTSTQDRNARIRVFDAIGQQIYLQNVSIPAGISQHMIPAEDWPAGVYLIQVSDDQFTSTQELIKTR